MTDKPQGKGPKLPKVQTKVNPRILVLLGIIVIGAAAYFGGTYFMQPPEEPSPPLPPQRPVTSQPASPAAIPKSSAKPSTVLPSASSAAKPATASAPAQPVSTASTAGGEVTIQVHTLSSKASAEKAVDHLKANGLDAFMVEQTISTEKVALQLTGYKTLEEAEADATVLRNSKVVSTPTTQKISDDQYVVNVGTYTKSRGIAMASKLKMLGYTVSSKSAGGKANAQVYVVQVGHYPSREVALASPEMAKLKEMKLSPLVVGP